MRRLVMRSLMLVAALMACGCETPADPEVTAAEVRAMEADLATLKDDLKSQIEALTAQLSAAEASRASLETQLKALAVGPPGASDVAYVSGPKPELGEPPWTQDDPPTNVEDAINLLFPYVSRRQAHATQNQDRLEEQIERVDAQEKGLEATDARVDGFHPSLVACPDGMIDVEGRFCVDSESRPPASLDVGRSVCYEDGARLCLPYEYGVAHGIGVTDSSLEQLIDDYAGPDSIALMKGFQGKVVEGLASMWAYHCCIGYADLVYRKAQ